MARTDQAAALTEQHRQAQLAVRTTTLRDFLLLWPLWNGDTSTFGHLVQATQPLVRTYHGISAALAASYYEAFRRAEEALGQTASQLAPPIDPTQLATSMYVTGQAMTRDAISGGAQPAEARRTALVRVSGAVTRHVLAGGRDTILQSVEADPEALGWARVTDGDPCAFCLTLASRGAVYKTEQSASFEAHDHCGCTAEPVYKGSKLPALTKRFRDIYDRAQNEGEASGLLQRGENTPSARINAVRRYLAAQQT
jgi:hypothetical protein